MKQRRKRLHVRQHMSHLGPQGPWFVGYWDRRRSVDPNQDFRCLTGGLSTAERAVQAASRIAAQRPSEYLWED